MLQPNTIQRIAQLVSACEYLSIGKGLAKTRQTGQNAWVHTSKKSSKLIKEILLLKGCMKSFLTRGRTTSPFIFGALEPLTAFELIFDLFVKQRMLHL